MSEQLKKTESKLDEVFVKKAPFQLPESVKKTIVQYLPWLNLVLAVLMLLAVRSLWTWAHWTNNLVNYTNNLSRLYGGTEVVATQRLSLMIWVSLIVLGVEAVIYLLAFPGLRARKKSGWNLLFYGALINIVYGVVVLFTDYGGAGSFIGSIVGSVIGLYFLFQIRSHYNGGTIKA